MGLLVFIVLLSVACRIGSAVVDLDDSKQELFLLQQRVNIVSNLLNSKCPGFVSKRVIKSEASVSAHIEVERELYTKLMEKYVECQKVKSMNLATSTTPTETDTTTTDEPTTMTTTPAPPYSDCQEYYERGYRKSGVYMIKLSNGNLPAFNVWCDFIDNHGWTVIQRRGNQSVSFNRDWNAYKSGFGDIDGEHWMGNGRIHFLTMTNQQLNILIKSKSDGQKNGIWKKFTISPESDNYRLTIDGSGYTGDLVDKFSSYHNGMAFSTSDRDNDNWSSNCAGVRQGGWWYNDCSIVNLNRGYGDGMYWWDVSSPLTLTVMRVTRD